MTMTVKKGPGWVWVSCSSEFILVGGTELAGQYGGRSPSSPSTTLVTKPELPPADAPGVSVLAATADLPAFELDAALQPMFERMAIKNLIRATRQPLILSIDPYGYGRSDPKTWVSVGPTEFKNLVQRKYFPIGSE